MKTQRLTSVSLSLLTVTLLPLAAACGSEKDGGSQTVGSGSGSGSAAAEVTGLHWTVDDLTVDGKKSEAPAGTYLKIDKNGEVGGNLGCNGFGADATVDGDKIALKEFLSTNMACGNDLMTFEGNLSEALQDGALTAQVKGDGSQQLTLTTKTGDTIHLTEEKPASLYGTKWTITTVGDTNAVSPLPSGGEAYLVLDQKKGTVSGKAGCNNVSADATVSDGTITLGSPSTTRRMCDGSLMEAEKSVLSLFGGKTKYTIDHRSLSLTSANGTTVSATAAK